VKKSRLILLWLLALACFLPGTTALSAEVAIKDTESATHGDDAAQYRIVDTYQYPGFQVVQFDLAVLSQYSYMVVSDGQALVVDPVRDVAAYLAYADRNQVKIIGVFLTHNNADFVAGHTELAKALGCPVYIGDQAGAGFANQPLGDGSRIEVGQAVVTVLETPGHTPEGTVGLLSAKSAPDQPLALLSGDTLFIGSVGRPDLMGGQMAAASLASMMYDSWHNKLSKLPDEVDVYPAHGAGSLCGAHLSDEPTSTIGAQRTANSYLQHKSRGSFIAAILEGLPEAPQYFKHNAAMNKQGPAPVNWQAPVEMLDPSLDLIDPAKYYLVDLREAKDYAAGHLPNSVNIGLRGRLETWVGIMVPWEADLVLCGTTEEIQEAVTRLHRVGYKPRAITLAAWEKSGLPLNQNKLVKPRDLYAQMQEGLSPVVVDVRLPSEWMGLRIGTVLNLPLNKLDMEAAKLEPDQPVVAVCNSAYRSSMAVGVLERRGFTQVASLDGGSQAWIDAGLPVYGSETQAQPTAAPKRDLQLPERISPADLKRKIMDIPGTFDLVDIRTPEAFADYSLPGAVNVDLAEVMSSPAYLTGAGPLILVDRDGSLAMAVGGILSQKTKRPIMVLHGGLEAYWQESSLAPAGTGMTVSPGQGTAQPPAVKAAPAPSTPPAAPTAPPQKPKKKSAGC
jgi:rhodanese-related sulfurtransferase/glyoxylase-like metal-dependent hydrolase (beta-lactamase superfamily II)